MQLQSPQDYYHYRSLRLLVVTQHIHMKKTYLEAGRLEINVVFMCTLYMTTIKRSVVVSLNC